jgi:hypothetical protein
MDRETIEDLWRRLGMCTELHPEVLLLLGATISVIDKQQITIADLRRRVETLTRRTDVLCRKGGR